MPQSTAPRPDAFVVSAIGMVSPVGATASQTYTSVRAGLRRMAELPGVYACLPDDPRFDEEEPLVGLAVYHLDTSLREGGAMTEWLAFLAAQAFRDLLRNARLDSRELGRFGAYLALPSFANNHPEVRDEFTVHFHNHAEQDLLPHFQVAFGDRTASLALAEEAVAAVGAGRLALAAVGGVDSYLFAPRLEALDGDWRILSDRNPDGFQPGEAAAFFLLEAGREATRRGAVPLARLGGFSAGRLDSSGERPNSGGELSAVLDWLLPSGGPSPLVVCDLNGESWRMREWGYALSRIGPRLSEGLALEHPASALGDVGAATGATLVALATQYLVDKHEDRPGALVWAASDDGERRAVSLGRV